MSRINGASVLKKPEVAAVVGAGAEELPSELLLNK